MSGMSDIFVNASKIINVHDYIHVHMYISYIININADC